MPTFDQLAPYIVGPVCGLVLSVIGNWYQAKEKKAFQDIIKGKDEDLKVLTKESIAGITTLAGLNQQNQRWQEQTTNALNDIKSKLP